MISIFGWPVGDGLRHSYSLNARHRPFIYSLVSLAKVGSTIVTPGEIQFPKLIKPLRYHLLISLCSLSEQP